MQLVTFTQRGSVPRPGLLNRDAVIDLRPLGYSDTLAFIRDGERALQAATTVTGSVPLADVQLLAPISNPPRIFCVGLNYRDHAIESKMEIPAVPTIFLKLPSAIIGPNAPIVLPTISKEPDYEAEFAAVIGRAGKNIAADDWRAHVFGYTILNDVSARDIQLSTTQWTLGKSFETFAPLGPSIVTADEIPDPHQLDIQLSIGGDVLQHSNTRELIFKLPELLHYISSIVTLQPGDIISTGTPAGVGLGRTPKRWLRQGEEVVIDVQSIGRLSNPIVVG